MSELDISIVTGDRRPIFKQIVDDIGMQIVRGHLLAGERLPSVRSLAMQLQINPNTVAKAYATLSAQGLAKARHGLGLFVAEPHQLFSEEERRKQLNTAIEIFINDIAYLRFSKSEIWDQLADALGELDRQNGTSKAVGGDTG